MLIDFFRKKIVEDDTEVNAYDYDLLGCYLAYEIAKSDGEVSSEEINLIKNELENIYKNSEMNADDVFLDIKKERDQSISFYELVKEINSLFEKDEKEFVIESLWKIAYADNFLDSNEDTLIRRIADMLGIKSSKVLQLKDKIKTSNQ